MDGGDDHIAREEIVPMAMDDKFGSTRQTPGGGKGRGRNGSDRRATEQRMGEFEMVSDTTQTVLWMIHSLAGEFIRRAEGRGGGTLGHRSFRDQISLPAVLHQNQSPHPSSPPPLIPIFPLGFPFNRVSLPNLPFLYSRFGEKLLAGGGRLSPSPRPLAIPPLAVPNSSNAQPHPRAQFSGRSRVGGHPEDGERSQKN
ncbi:hypothetical protein niasHT_001577 [Heterodera trifolii]|uniref:Uncharacterized protein n=1 Tax=Heterodera trifolii TaxID=157864 RepID=A0ABD2MB41_9BILA